MKNFFTSIGVQIAAWAMFILSVLVLLYNGVTGDQIANVVQLVIGVVSAIGLLIVAIGKLIKKKWETAGK